MLSVLSEEKVETMPDNQSIRFSREQAINDILEMVLSSDIGLLTDRKLHILRLILLYNLTPKEVTEKLSLSQHRVKQIFNHAMQIIKTRAGFLNEKLKNAIEISRELEELRKKVEYYQKKDEFMKQLHPGVQEVLKKRVDDFYFSIRAKNVFEASDIIYVRDLVKHRKRDLLQFRNTGKKTIAEIEKFLNEKGLRLGMDLSGN